MPSTSHYRKKASTVTFLRAYKFGDDKKDPIIDRVRACLDEAGMSLGDCQKGGGPSYTTLHNWFEGETRRPQYATVCAAIRSAGFDFVVAKVGTHVNGNAWNAEMPRIAKTLTLARKD